MWQSLQILNVFNTFTLKNISEKQKPFFKKKLEHHFGVESTTIESITYIYKSTLSKWTCHKEHSFASIYFIFLKIWFQEPVIKCWFEVSTTPMSMFILSESTGVLFEGAFSHASILKTYAATIRNNLNTNVSCFMTAVLLLLLVH